MEQVKIFFARLPIFVKPEDLEKKINNWLAENPNVEITRVVQSSTKFDGVSTTITIFYRKSK